MKYPKGQEEEDNGGVDGVKNRHTYSARVEKFLPLSQHVELWPAKTVFSTRVLQHQIHVTHVSKKKKTQRNIMIK